MTLPISAAQAVVGKFLAAWAFTGVALVLTATHWLTVNYLGEPDNGVIAASYIGASSWPAPSSRWARHSRRSPRTR